WLPQQSVVKAVCGAYMHFTRLPRCKDADPARGSLTITSRDPDRTRRRIDDIYIGRSEVLLLSSDSVVRHIMRGLSGPLRLFSLAPPVTRIRGPAGGSEKLLLQP